MKPDYRHDNLVNLMASLVTGLGGLSGGYPPLASLPPAMVAAASHVVLLILDGVGYDYLRQHGTLLNRYLHGRLGSVFPTSTAPAISSLLTGVAPQQHAITGWFMHFKELGTVAVSLPFQPRWGRVPFRAVSPAALLGHGAIFDNRLEAHGYHLLPQRLMDSAYSRVLAGTAERVGYRGLADYFASLARLVRHSRKRAFVYAYWPGFDTLAHHHGVGSRTARRHLRALERGIADLLTALAGSGTLLLVTADHGFIDSGPAFTTHLQQHPELADCLALPLCGEPRVAYCYVRPGRTARFERYVRERLANCVALYPSEQLLADGWFGMGEADPRLADRIGDYILITHDRQILKDVLPTEKPWQEIGVHGGVSDAERYVPLLLMQC